MRVHHVELPDRARSKQFLGLGVDDRTHPLASNLQDSIARASGVDHFRAIGINVDHGLLAVDVFARFHGVDRNLLVPMIGSADDDGVHVFARQDLVVVACGKNVRAPHFLAVFEPSIIRIGDRDEFDSGNLKGGPGIELALTTSADQRNLNVIIGGDRRGGFSLSGQSVGFRSHHGGGGCGAGHFKKASAVQHLCLPPGFFELETITFFPQLCSSI